MLVLVVTEMQTWLFLDPLGRLSFNFLSSFLVVFNVVTVLSSKIPAVFNDISGLADSFFQAFGAPCTDRSAFLMNQSDFTRGSTPALCFEGFSPLLLRPCAYYKAVFSRVGRFLSRRICRCLGLVLLLAL